MASTGFIIAVSGANVSLGLTDWTNPGNLTANDNVQVTAVLPNNTNTNYLKGSNFGFAALIPAGSTIDGIEMQFESDRDSATWVDRQIRLSKDGTNPVGDDKSTGAAWGINPSVRTFGGATDLWNTSWTRAEVVSTNFSALIQAGTTGGGGTLANLDYIEVNVHYTEAAAASSLLLPPLSSAIMSIIAR